MSQPANYYAPDGYRYAVRFDSDRSIASYWNGSTQRARAEEYLLALRRAYPGDRFSLVRRPHGGPFEVVE